MKIKTVLDENVDLLSYLPEFMREFSEIKQITSTENEEFKELYKLMKKELFNQFIETCDKDGIVNFEKLLNLKVDESLSLETRKFNVITRLGGELPYTKRNLIKKLNQICGENAYKLEILNNEYKVKIITSFINENMKDILINSLRNIIPANMIIENQNQINLKTELIINSGIITSEFKTYRIGE